MCAQAARLSDLKLKAAKTAEKDYILADGDGLQMPTQKASEIKQLLSHQWITS
jgi:hypothetical protein